MLVAIHGREMKPENIPVVQKIIQYLANLGISTMVSASFADFLGPYSIPINQTFGPKESLQQVDLIMSIGGDGTLLESVLYAGAAEVPILGVNTGRLGFLATISPENIASALNRWQKGQFHIEQRSLIEVQRPRELFSSYSFGLNEFTILKESTSSMVIVHTFVDEEYLNAYWADGLIISTPTGSTGYSLSCGGPIVSPQANCFILTPVSPHNLNMRPLVLSDDKIISLEVESRSNNVLVSLDARSMPVDRYTKITVQKAKFCAKLVKFDIISYYDTLRNKLNWGKDARNR